MASPQNEEQVELLRGRRGVNADELTKRLAVAEGTPRTAADELSDAKAFYNRLLQMGGRPTRPMKNLAADDTFPHLSWVASNLFAHAVGELDYWQTEAGQWRKFCVWRAQKKGYWTEEDKKKRRGPEAVPPLPQDVDALTLHLEFRDYLMCTAAKLREAAKVYQHKMVYLVPVEERLERLEIQLTEMRKEKQGASDTVPATENTIATPLVPPQEHKRKRKENEIEETTQQVKRARRIPKRTRRGVGKRKRSTHATLPSTRRTRRRLAGLAPEHGLVER